jgi:hypothetical protein
MQEKIETSETQWLWHDGIPLNKLVEMHHLSQIPGANSTRPMHGFWVASLIDLLYGFRNMEIVRSGRPAEQTKKFLRSVDRPEALAPIIPSSIPATFKEPISGLIYGLVLWGRGIRELRLPERGATNQVAARLFRLVREHFGTSRNPEDKLVVSYADLAYALVAGKSRYGYYSKRDLQYVQQKYRNDLRSRSLMATYHLAIYYDHYEGRYRYDGCRGDALKMYGTILKHYKDFSEWLVYSQARINRESLLARMKG